MHIIKDINRIDLHEELSKKSYDHAIICTYAFNPDYFEKHCLEEFNSLKNNGNITVLIDNNIYQKMIRVSSSDKPKQANLRYFLYPVSVPGVFHTKLILLASKNSGKLIIGSANMTRAGITSNAELVGCYDYEEQKNEDFKFLFQDAFRRIKTINERWPSKTLSSNINAIERDAIWLTGEDKFTSEENVLIDNSDQPLWNKIISNISPPVDTIYVLSRYFDSRPAILDQVYESLKPGKIKIFTQNGVTTLTKEWLAHPLVKKGIVEIFLCRYDSIYHQPLHGKSIAIRKNDKYILAYGSANFTLPALFKNINNGNMELMFLIKELDHKEFNPEELFNPISEAVRLEEEGQLQTAIVEERQFSTDKHEIMLFEAELVGKKIEVRAKIPEEIDYDTVTAKLIFQNNSSRSFNLTQIEEGMYSFETTDDIMHFLNNESSILQIEIYKNNKIVGDSNVILITNLLDIKSGQNVRRQRHIKEAQQGLEQFFQVLVELGNGDDSEALQIFLEYCDIPVINASVPLLNRGIKPIADFDKGMRNLGERNLLHFVELHELVIYFVDRHLKKLNRHIASGSLEGIFNFLHIFMAIGAVLYMQIERAIQGFELKTKPLTIDQWYDYRKQFDIYFIKFEELSICLSKYITKMLSDYELFLIQERFSPNYKALDDFYKKILSIKNRIDFLTETKLRVIRPGNIILTPSYNPYNIFVPRNWLIFESEIQTNLSILEGMLKDRKD